MKAARPAVQRQTPIPLLSANPCPPIWRRRAHHERDMHDWVIVQRVDAAFWPIGMSPVRALQERLTVAGFNVINLAAPPYFGMQEKARSFVAPSRRTSGRRRVLYLEQNLPTSAPQAARCAAVGPEAAPAIPDGPCAVRRAPLGKTPFPAMLHCSSGCFPLLHSACHQAPGPPLFHCAWAVPIVMVAAATNTPSRRDVSNRSVFICYPVSSVQKLSHQQISAVLFSVQQPLVNLTRSAPTR